MRLEVGTDLSSYTWTFEGAPSPPPKKDDCSWETDYLGSTNSKHSFSIYYEPGIVPGIDMYRTHSILKTTQEACTITHPFGYKKMKK